MIYCIYRTRICCGIIFKGPYGEIIIDQSLFKTCSSCLLRQENKQQSINAKNSFHSSSVSSPHSVDSTTTATTTTTTTELTKQTGKIFSDSSSDSGYDESSNQGIDGRKNIKISNSNNSSSNNSCITTTKKLTTNILIQPVKKIQLKTKTTITETVRLQNDMPIKLIPVEKLTCKSLVSSTTKQVNSLVDFAIHTPRQSVTN